MFVFKVIAVLDGSAPTNANDERQYLVRHVIAAMSSIDRELVEPALKW